MPLKEIRDSMRYVEDGAVSDVSHENYSLENFGISTINQTADKLRSAAMNLATQQVFSNQRDDAAITHAKSATEKLLKTRTQDFAFNKGIPISQVTKKDYEKIKSDSLSEVIKNRHSNLSRKEQKDLHNRVLPQISVDPSVYADADKRNLSDIERQVKNGNYNNRYKTDKAGNFDPEGTKKTISRLAGQNIANRSKNTITEQSLPAAIAMIDNTDLAEKATAKAFYQWAVSNPAIKLSPKVQEYYENNKSFIEQNRPKKDSIPQRKIDEYDFFGNGSKTYEDKKRQSRKISIDLVGDKSIMDPETYLVHNVNKLLTEQAFETKGFFRNPNNDKQKFEYQNSVDFIEKELANNKVLLELKNSPSESSSNLYGKIKNGINIIQQRKDFDHIKFDSFRETQKKKNSGIPSLMAVNEQLFKNILIQTTYLKGMFSEQEKREIQDVARSFNAENVIF